MFTLPFFSSLSPLEPISNARSEAFDCKPGYFAAFGNILLHAVNLQKERQILHLG